MIHITHFVSCCSEIIVFLVWTRTPVVTAKTKHNKANESTGVIYTWTHSLIESSNYIRKERKQRKKVLPKEAFKRWKQWGWRMKWTQEGAASAWQMVRLRQHDVSRDGEETQLLLHVLVMILKVSPNSNFRSNKWIKLLLQALWREAQNFVESAGLNKELNDFWLCNIYG